MKILCKLAMPKGASLLQEYISVPATEAGLAFVDWWKTASHTDRLTVARSTDTIATWKKLADMAGESTDKTQHDLKNVIRMIESENESLGDPSPTSQPPATNP